MFTYSFESKETKSLYLQLYAFIKADILGGRLQAGERLPSKRAAAKNLGVSVITVENAYAALQSEGYVYSLPKKGYYVSEIAALFPAAAKPLPAVQEAPRETDPAYRYSFAANGIIPENFPFSIWARLMRETLNTARAEVSAAPPSGGLTILKEAICAHVKQFRGMEVTPAQVIIGAGTEYLYSLIIQLLGGEKTYAVPNPGYAKLARIYESVGVKCAYVSEDAQGMDIASLAHSGAHIAHVSPAHHFPSGTVMSISRRHELLNWAAQSAERYIIEDDYDSEFRLSGRPLPALQSLDSAGKVIYVNPFTKSLSPTIRISYMVLPRALTGRFYERLGFYSSTVSSFEQYTLAQFIRRGYFEKHINRMRNYYRKIRNCLLEAIQSSALAALARVSEEEAGLHFLLHLRTDAADADLKQQAALAGTEIRFLSEYYRHASPAIPAHILVVNYSTLRMEDIPAAVKALEKVICESNSNLAELNVR